MKRMNNLSKKIVIGTVTVATIATSAGAAYAQDIQSKVSGRQWREAAHQAIEKGSYDDWLSAQKQAFEKRTSKERFDQLQTFHQLLTDGKQAEAKAFAKEHKLGIKKLRHLQHHTQS